MMSHVQMEFDPAQTSKLEVTLKEEHIAQVNRAALDKLGISSLNLGRWVLFVPSELDYLSGSGGPVVSLTLLYNLSTGQFISRVLNRIFEEGCLTSEAEVKDKCEGFFIGKYPCLGASSVQSDGFPQGLKFAPDCTKVVDFSGLPPSLSAMICVNCCNVLEDKEDKLELFHADDVFDGDSEPGDLAIKLEEDPGDLTESKPGLDAVKIAEDLPRTDPCLTFQSGPPNPVTKRKRTPAKRFLSSAIVGPKAKGSSRRELTHQRKNSYEIELQGMSITLDTAPIKGDTKWSCPLCPQSVTSRQFHLERHHGIYKMDCHQCQDSFMCPLKFVDHTKEVHKTNQSAQCKLCKEIVDVSGPRESFKAHVDGCIAEATVKYRASHFLYNKTSKGRDRQRKELVCDSCAYSCKSMGALNKHIRHVHEGKKDLWTCPECSKLMSTCKKSRHLRRIHHYANFRCPQCFIIERTGINFVNHMMLNHPEILQAQCPECKGDFSISSELISHHNECLDHHLKRRKQAINERISSKPHLHVCTVCSKGFPLRYILNSHMRTHKELSHHCAKCSYRTHSEELFEDHMRIHAADRTSDCCLCEESFDSPESLHKHLKVKHEEGTTAPCPICGAVFSKIGLLRSHLYREHPQGANLNCNQCHFQAQSLSDLNSHVQKSHSQQLPSQLCEFDRDHSSSPAAFIGSSSNHTNAY